MEIVQAADMTETQKNLELLFNKNQLIPVLREQFQEVTEDPFEVDVLVQIYLHKQADVATMVGIFTPKWGKPQDVADMLLECAEKDLLDFAADKGVFSLKYAVSEDVEVMLARYQYPLPMITKPKEIYSNKGAASCTGYETIKAPLVLNGSDVFDGMDICVDHLNRANAVALSLDMDVLATPEGKPLMPKRKQGEEYADYLKRKRQAETFYGVSEEVMNGLLAFGNELYLTHKYDRRGRTYASGYHVNTQGTDWNKAVLELANKEVVE
jgi:hypothetical protein